MATENLGRVEGEGAREAFVQADAKLRQVNAHTLDLTQREVDELNDFWWAIMKTIEDVQPVTAEHRAAKAHAGYLAAMYEATTRVSVP